MKNFSKLKMNDASFIEEDEMKHIVGGASGGGCSAYLCQSDSNCPPAISGLSHCTKCYHTSNASVCG